MKTGLLIAGHGSRSKEACDIFNKVVAYVKEKSDFSYVTGGYMEISLPSIEMGINDLYSEGVRNIIIAPYFLYPGIHIKEDIPEIVKKIKNEKFSDVSFTIAEPLGFAPEIAELVIKKADKIRGVQK